MNRLWVRLTLAFALVGFVGTGGIALFTNWQAGPQVRQYLARQDSIAQSGLIDALSTYYKANHGWQGVGEVLAAYSAGRGEGAGSGRGRPPLLIADVEGRIVYDERGSRIGGTLTSEEQGSALPILAAEKTAGWLAVTPAGGTESDTAAEGLLDQLRTTLLVSTLLAVLVSVGLGLALGRWLAAPLDRMAEGVRHFSGREWTYRIPERGSVETTEVTRALNGMAAFLEHAETMRRNLTADIAHELRTPLTVLQGNLRAILDGVYPLERDEIASLYDETRLLSRLVDDLRELALADDGKPLLRIESVLLDDAISAVMREFAGAADAGRISMQKEIADRSLAVRADPDRLRQVMVNLLANALRHLPEGGRIQLVVEPGAGFAKVSVIDSGKGISAKDLPHVFERYYRAEPDRNTPNGGTGLGLAVVKAWSEAMGGEIGVESTPGKGSRFWFTIPRDS